MGAGSADYPPALDAPSDRMSRAVPLPGRNVLSRNWLTAGAAVLIALTSGVTLATRHFLSPGTDPQKPGILTVTTSAPGVLVVVDGYTRGRTPLTTDVAPGEHTVELVTDGGRRKIPVTMAPGGTVSQFVEVGSTSNTGKVHVRTDPAGARVSVDGNYFGSSPITVDGLAPGVHSVQVGDERDAVTEKVTIEAGATAAVVVPLRGSRASTPGWIVVTAPADVQLFENQTLIGTSRNSRVMVPAGRHQLDLVNEALGYRSSQSVQVEPGMEAKLKPVWPKATVAFNALPWAEVRVDGERVGDTPLGSVSLAIGPHDVVFRHPELGERHQQIMVTLKEPLRLSVDLRKK